MQAVGLWDNEFHRFILFSSFPFLFDNFSICNFWKVRNHITLTQKEKIQETVVVRKLELEDE